MAKLADLDSGSNLREPIFAIVETTLDEESPQDRIGQPNDDEHHGATLLQHISAHKVDFKLSKLVIPIAMLHDRMSGGIANPQGLASRLTRPSSGGLDWISKSISSSPRNPHTTTLSNIEPWKMLRCLQFGATEVLSSPLTKDRVASLAVHAYHAKEAMQKERSALLATKKIRKRSWVGFDDKKPYAYLREQMYGKSPNHRMKQAFTDVSKGFWPHDWHMRPRERAILI